MSNLQINNKYEERLLNEWKTHRRIIVAVDFDDTISPWGFKGNEHEDDLQKTIKTIKIAREVGAYIFIWSSCTPDRFDYIKQYCKDLGLEIDAINDNPIELPYGKHKKIYYNILIDDRSGINESLSILEKCAYHIRAAKVSEKLDNPGSTEF